jgi:hypothetical protein
VYEWALGAVLSRRFQQMKSAQCIGLEIEKGNRSCTIMRRLRGSMDDKVGLHLFDERQQCFTIPDVESAVSVVRNLFPESAQNPSCISFGAEENGAEIAVDTDNFEPQLREK